MNSPSPIGFLFIAFIGFLLPWAVFKSRRQAAAVLIPDRPAYYRKVIRQQILILLFAVLTAWYDQIPLGVGALTFRTIGLTLIAFVLLVAGMRPVWLKAVRDNDPGPRRFAPRNAGERRGWVLVSLTAGCCEEIVWRGVLTTELWWVLDHWWLAAGLSAVSFGVGHAIQGVRKMIIIAALAILCQLIVRESSGLLLAMLLHAAYDVVAGLTYGKHIRE